MRYFSSACILFLFSTICLAEQAGWSENMMSAILQEDTAKIQALALQNKDLNKTPEDGKSPFVEAVIQSNPEILEVLINAGFDPNKADKEGYTPIMYALQFGRIDNAKKLESLGASLEGITNDGYTVRVLAENVGLDNFGPLYESKNNYELTKEEANQILLYAAEMGDVEAVKFAIKNKADLDIKAKNGWTPIMLAGLGGHTDVFDRLTSDFLIQDDFYYEADGVDLITAVLVGGRDGDSYRVEVVKNMLDQIKVPFFFSKYNAPQNKIKSYRKIAEKLKYPLHILNYFPKSYEPQPKLESDIPVGIPSTKENWKLVQKVLKDAGVYRGAIDGQPGKGTGAALYAYYMPLAKVLKERSVKAAMEAYSKVTKEYLLDEGINAICRVKKFWKDSDAGLRFCGEYQMNENSNAIFSGYILVRNGDDRVYNYLYLSGHNNYDETEKILRVAEIYKRSKNSEREHHTYIRADVLDTSFIMYIYRNKIEYQYGNSPKYTIKGKYNIPLKPKLVN